ncbi:MAG TPA: amidohydrolase [Phototrophicaceae bacterium]|nr:amidohydrolase [Phototrophicaceae bacterium]
MLFYNGTIHTLDANYPQAEAVAVANGRITAVGTLAEVEAAVGRGVKRIDLGGRTLLPGFNDAHVHVWKLGLLLTRQVDARQAAAPNLATIVRLFREKAAPLLPGTWLTGRGYNEADLPERRHPTRYDLDAASSDHPIALTRTCGHMIVANSLALRLAGITANTPNPPGGVIVHDEHGQPTGLLQETAMGLLTRVMPEPAEADLADAIQAAQRHQLALGITSATDPLLAPLHLRVYRRLDAEGQLSVRVNGMPIRRPDGGTETLLLPEKFVSDWLRIDTVKFFADGGLSGATAAISQPYKVTGERGVLRFDTEDLLELAWEAHAAGFRIGTHAIGDVAIEQVISVYEELHRRAAQTGAGTFSRHRIEHLGLPTADHLRRCAALKIIAPQQTVFLPALGTSFRRYLPDEFLPRCYPVRAVLDAGLTVALSSDAPVVPDDNPLLGIKAAVNRWDANGEPIAPEQAITAAEALYAYTMGSAIASGDEVNRSSITPGKWADLIVLSGDPLTTSPEELLTLRVEQTYVGGKLRYEG